jgi:low affinity Fe/Cu permease
MSVSDMFSAISRKAAVAAGTWQASILATSIVVAWIIGGFFVGFDDQLYQLFINTFTTITTFVMVFLIQADQNRGTKAVQLKLDEIIRAIEKADNRLIDIEQDTDEHIEAARRSICSRKDSS